MMLAHGETWGLCAASTAAVITRPFGWPEAIWALLGATLLLLFGLMPASAAFTAVGKGMDVYLFLIGMMLLSETARALGLFDWVASTAAMHSKGSTSRLFLLVYVTGIVTTAFLSNDATEVALTPAVFAAAKKSKAEPLPLLFACALIANAASFVLPISNPANLVLHGGKMPPLGVWFGSFALPSVASIVVTYLALRWVERKRPCDRGRSATRPTSRTSSRAGRPTATTRSADRRLRRLPGLVPSTSGMPMPISFKHSTQDQI